MDGLVVVLTAVPDRQTGLRLGRQLVEGHFAACAQILPVMTSIYRWQGEVHTEDEHLLLLKLPRQALAPLQEMLERLHPYEVPEIVALDADAVNGSYLAWARAGVDGSS